MWSSLLSEKGFVGHGTTTPVTPPDVSVIIIIDFKSLKEFLRIPDVTCAGDVSDNSSQDPFSEELQSLETDSPIRNMPSSGKLENYFKFLCGSTTVASVDNNTF